MVTLIYDGVTYYSSVDYFELGGNFYFRCEELSIALPDAANDRRLTTKTVDGDVYIQGRYINVDGTRFCTATMSSVTPTTIKLEKEVKQESIALARPFRKRPAPIKTVTVFQGESLEPYFHPS